MGGETYVDQATFVNSAVLLVSQSAAAASGIFAFMRNKTKIVQTTELKNLKV